MAEENVVVVPAVETETIEYTQADFAGLLTYLDTRCIGPDLMGCTVSGDTNTDAAVQAYLLQIDKCLYDSLCLDYHQSLFYREKLNGKVEQEPTEPVDE